VLNTSNFIIEIQYASINFLAIHLIKNGFLCPHTDMHFRLNKWLGNWCLQSLFSW